MTKTLYYLFDPLCGWCYGAMSALSALSEVPAVNIELLPTGLFSGEGARPMNSDFAAYAWSNDQRIERLTGQRFTELYREQVLGDHQRPFDSGPATVALTAVFLTAPARELEALKAIQTARYVDGQDTTSLETLAGVLRALGLEQAAELVTQPDEDLLSANQARMDRAQALMREFGARGVPTLVAESGAKRWVVNHADFYSNPSALAGELEAA